MSQSIMTVGIINSLGVNNEGVGKADAKEKTAGVEEPEKEE